MGYQLNVQLREGETLTRNWFNKGKVIDWVDADILEGGKASWACSGSLATRPPAGSATASWNTMCRWPAALSAAGPLAENLAATSEDRAAPAVHVKDAARPGVLVLRMPTSYVYVSGTLAFKAVVPQRRSVPFRSATTRAWTGRRSPT